VTRKTLVAGCGNIFLGDDGFGVEVARRLSTRSLPEGVKSLGSTVQRFLVVGCEPAEVSERIGLSPPVAAAVDEAVRVIEALVMDDEKGEKPCSDG
jgi:Ni,Fe-hydrogenase maturation factor